MEKNSGWHVCIILALISACYVNTRAVAKVAALFNFNRNYLPGCNATIKPSCIALLYTYLPIRQS